MKKSDYSQSIDRLGTEEDIIERQKRHLAKRKEFVTQLEVIDGKYREEIISLIGKDDYEKYLPQHKKLLGKLRRPELFDTSPQGMKKEKEFQESIIAERHGLYRSMGFPHEQAIKLRHSYRRQAADLIEKYLGLDDKLEYISKDISQVPKTNNPWTRYRAPYFDEWGTSSSGTSRGTCWATHTENRWSGAIQCNSFTRVVGADDSDSGWSRSMSEVWVRFRMPAAGLIEVVAVLTDIDTRLEGRLIDEAGCSDGYASQLARTYLWTSGGVERYQIRRNFSVSTDGDNRSWNYSETDPGENLYPHIFSSESYSQGQWVTVAIGIQDDSSFRVNDMSVNPSKITSHFFVKDIYVRSTGAP